MSTSSKFKPTIVAQCPADKEIIAKMELEIFELKDANLKLAGMMDSTENER